MTQFVHMTAPTNGNGKDPNDFRDNPNYHRDLEAKIISENREGAVDLKAYRAIEKKGRPIPIRKWAWNNWASFGVVTGLSGPPGVAKSLFAQQLCTHSATGIPLLRDAATKVPALHLTCEDDEDELDRRQVQICTAMGIEIPDNLHLMSWVGEETLLVYQENGRFIRTRRFHALSEYIGDNKIQMVTMDLIPDFWNGNEINRTHVNAFVKSHLAYLARQHNAAVIPLFHPSKSGMSDGTGTSGSTAWEGSFRGRIYLSRMKDDDMKSPDRTISRVKANYASLDEKEMTWKDGYLWERGTVGEPDRDKANLQAFLEILKYCNNKDIEVSPANNSSNYYGRNFPNIWKEMDGRHKNITKRAMEKAYLKAQMDSVVEIIPRTKNSARRLKFIGYGVAK